MKKRNYWSIAILLCFGFLIASCADDTDLVDSLTGDDEETIDSPTDFGNDVTVMSSSLLEELTDLMLSLEQHTFGMRPNGSARAIAYINLATYETLQPGMAGSSSMVSHLNGLRINTSEYDDDVNFQLALTEAYTSVLRHFFGSLSSERLALIDDFEAAKDEALSAILDSEIVELSEDWGQHVADRVIQYSQTDEEAEEQLQDPQPRSYEPPTGDGFWTYSADPERALFPYWGSVRTFMVGVDETTTIEPISYSSTAGSAYHDQMLEAYTSNNQARADQGEELWIAEFWSDDVEGLMISPPARQISIANQLIDQYDMTMSEAASMLLKVGFALNDAAVATWKYKYDHMVMRPNVFIHEFIDPDFQTNLFRLVFWPNPSFPGYPSGHSCFASAAAGIFIAEFGDQTDFTDRTHEGRQEFLGSPRAFDSFSDMAEENAYSRIPLGVHIRMDCDEGLRLGYEIAENIARIEL